MDEILKAFAQFDVAKAIIEALATNPQGMGLEAIITVIPTPDDDEALKLATSSLSRLCKAQIVSRIGMVYVFNRDAFSVWIAALSAIGAGKIQ
jgi:hypothetical protein